MFEAQIKQTYPETVAFIIMRGAYSQTPDGLDGLYVWIEEQGLSPAGMPAAVYLTIPEQTPEDEGLWELLAPVAGAPGAREPDASGIGIKEIPPMTVASTMHTGPYAEVGPTYEALTDWIDKNGYELAGPPKEIWYSDPEAVPEEEYLTEIQFPVQPK